MESFKKFLKKDKQPKYHHVFLSIKHRKHQEVVTEKLDRFRSLHGYDVLTRKDQYLSKSHWGDASPKNRGRDTEKFDENEKKAIENYTGSDYRSFNRKLYAGEELSSSQMEMDRHLSSAIAKSYAPRNMHVFTGLRSPEDLEKHTSGHILIQNNGYTSTSISPGEANNFSGKKTHGGENTHHWYWKSPHNDGMDHLTKFDPEMHGNDWEFHKDTPSYTPRWKHKDKSEPNGYWQMYSHIAKIHVPKNSSGLYVEPGSSNQGEKEYVLHRNAKMAIKPEPTIDHDNKLVIWHGALVHDGIHATRHGTKMNLFKEEELSPRARQKSFDFGKDKNPMIEPKNPEKEYFKDKLKYKHEKGYIQPNYEYQTTLGV